MALVSPPASSAPAVGTTPTMAQQLQFFTGLNADGTVSTTYAAEGGVSGSKWGTPTAGTGATITYAFDPATNFTAAYKLMVLTAMANWEATGNVTFVEDTDPTHLSSVNILLQNNTASTAYATDPSGLTVGSGATLGQRAGQQIVTVDIATFGVDAPSAWRHELGHALSFGHSGNYNGSGGNTPATTQFSAFDDHQYTTMSYVAWNDADAIYGSQNPNPGTNWGNNPDGARTYSDTIQMLDIMAVQQVYGVSTLTTFNGGQTYGFNSTITGLLHDTYDFGVNTAPVLTLFNKGTGNTLDVSGFSAAARIDLHDGRFSDAAGLRNNIAIAIGTRIDNAIGGSGDDSLTGNDNDNILIGGAGNDIIDAGAGDDRIRGGAGNDVVIGGAGRDLIDGGDGNDELRGGTGTANELAGGSGDDLFIVEAIGDTILEAANGGTDEVRTALAVHVLRNNVENLHFTNDVSHLGIGNIGDNVIMGGAAGDSLFGREGNDTLIGGTGAANTLLGQEGDDIYVIEAAGDSVIEFVNQGIDTVQTVRSVFTLRAHVENLTYTGTGTFTGIGAVDNNQLTGGALADFLSGLDGNDILIGKSGADFLLGGAGSDQYRYEGGETGFDRISDFVSGIDKITLRDAGFAQTIIIDLVQSGAPVATTTNSTFLYNVNNGMLSFDADGTGAGAAVVLAQLNAGLTLAPGDFLFY